MLRFEKSRINRIFCVTEDLWNQKRERVQTYIPKKYKTSNLLLIFVTRRVIFECIRRIIIC